MIRISWYSHYFVFPSPIILGLVCVTVAKVIVSHFQDYIIKDTMASILAVHILFLRSFIPGELSHRGKSTLLERLA